MFDNPINCALKVLSLDNKPNDDPNTGADSVVVTTGISDIWSLFDGDVLNPVAASRVENPPNEDGGMAPDVFPPNAGFGGAANVDAPNKDDVIVVVVDVDAFKPADVLNAKFGWIDVSLKPRIVAFCGWPNVDGKQPNGSVVIFPKPSAVFTPPNPPNVGFCWVADVDTPNGDNVAVSKPKPPVDVLNGDNPKPLVVAVGRELNMLIDSVVGPNAFV